MLIVPGYQNFVLIYESANSLVYRANRTIDNRSVILKRLQQNYPTPAELVHYKQEYEITHNLNITGICRSLSLEKYQNSFVIIFDDFGGESLKKWMEKRTFNLKEFLQIAIATTDSLTQIHRANIIHKDINPANIVYNFDTQEIKIIDFGISTLLTKENPILKNPHILEGTLPYMSPEQTGRMNRSLDYRTDFYSLGVTFYELLTNQLPFDTTDALELLHWHIAKQALSPSQLNPEIPEIISDIVLKLMAKTAEERYQSALGIKADLENCLKQLQNNGSIASFPIGNQDISDKFQIPQQLYGRETEINTLLQAFERVSINASELMLINGYSGIGKSALVQEIYKPITQKRGYFIAGKFDQFQRNVPYAAIVTAFQSLVKLLLTESAEKLAHWQKIILASLGVNAQIIIDVIPEVELIIGQQPDVPELGPAEAQNRFNLVFQNFIHIFCTEKHPLVIFLDDLQWADAATIKLIELIIADTSIKYLFLIGAYRDNEVTASHPLKIMLDSVSKLGKQINYLTLNPLNQNHINQLIADTLYKDENSVQPLTELVINKTKGNPFFVNQFLKTLHHENLLSFDFNSGNWQWNITQIQEQDITDNVVELMIGKLRKLPESTQIVLQLASCIGANFDLNTIAIVCEKSAQDIFADLLVAVKSELIIATSEVDYELLIQDYKFLHDRVQQAAYALITDNKKQGVHLKIGRLLLKNTKNEEVEIKMFDIVNHLNQGLQLISDRSEKNTIIELNLKAGKIARSSTAYESASQYLQQGIELLPENSWQNFYEITFQLYFEQAQCQYLLGHPEQADQLFTITLENTKSNLQAADIYDIQMQIYFTQGKFADGVRIGKQSLKMFGIIIADNDTEIINQEQQAYQEVEFLLQSKTTDDILNKIAMNDPEKKACMQLIVFMWAHAMLLTQYHLLNLVTLLMVKISLTDGNSDISGYGYSCYGGMLAAKGEYSLAYEYGLLSLKLTEKYHNIVFKGKVLNYFCHFINPFKRHLQTNVDLYLTSYQACLECGDVVYGVWAAFFYVWNRFLKGDLLTEVNEQTHNYYHFICQTKDWNMLNVLLLQRGIVLNLQGMTTNVNSLSYDNFDEDECLANFQTNQFAFGLAYYTLYKIQILFLNSEYSAALTLAENNYQIITAFSSFFIVTEFYFYYCLTLIGIYPSHDEKDKLWQNIIDIHSKIKTWSDECPENFYHKYTLVSAEIARISAKPLDAMQLYDQAIYSARNHEFIQYEALANELAAKFWLEKNKEEFAQLYLKKAHYSYKRWGAKGKVEVLEAKYPQLFTKISLNEIDRNTITSRISTTNKSGDLLDITTVMKASITISGEIVIDKLLSSLMKILLENAGAEKGFLILPKQGKLFIEAEGYINKEGINIYQSLAIENCQLLSELIVNYVTRTKESIVINDASYEIQFNHDPYIQKNQTKSILCVPLINQGKLISIVYLENNLTTGAFTQERVEIIKLLSGQAAISLENARFYNRMAELNKAYERFVPRQFLQFLQKESILDVQLGDQVQLEMSVLFSDIRDFTQISEQMTPEDNFKFINAYLSRMESAIIENQGFIDKYIGDAIMALFSGEADDAVKAGIAMLKKLNFYNQERINLGLEPIRNGIGINTGLLMLGTVGGENRMDGTVISDAVNLASRIEDLTKQYGVSLLISEHTFMKLKNTENYAIRQVDKVKVKGKSKLVTIYEVFDGDSPKTKEQKLATLSTFNQACEDYDHKNLTAAILGFEACLRINPSDRIAEIYLQRCLSS